MKKIPCPITSERLSELYTKEFLTDEKIAELLCSEGYEATKKRVLRWRLDFNIQTLKQYDWELAPDTNTTWRIGDGTAAFYNYIYYTIAGFTEHDTFRSNQIREGQITREEALRLVEDENRPRYQNIRWYLDAVGLDYVSAIKVVNDAKQAERV